MQRYFAQIVNQKVVLNDDDKNHLLLVMRSDKNDIIEVVNDKKLYEAKIISTDPLNISIVKELKISNELEEKIILIVSILKGEKNDLVIQKATEIGVEEIVFVKCEHCIGKIKKEDYEKKLTRFRKIAKEASQQSKRNNVPKVEKIIDYNDLENIESDVKLIASLCDDRHNKEAIDKIKNTKKNESIAILIGPEGGFTKREEDFARDNDFVPISLGKRVLRAETAAICGANVISFLLENR